MEDTINTILTAVDNKIDDALAIGNEGDQLKEGVDERKAALPVTHALEALLGGLDSPSEDVHMEGIPKTKDESVVGHVSHTNNVPEDGPSQMAAGSVIHVESTTMKDLGTPHTVPAQLETNEVQILEDTSIVEDQVDTPLEDVQMDDAPKTEEESITDNLSETEEVSFLKNIQDTKDAPRDVDLQREEDSAMVRQPEAINDAPYTGPEALQSEEMPKPEDTSVVEDALHDAHPEEENPEWEIDSSPIETSSDDSSSDDSSSENSDEDGDNAYKLLSPEEQARILMEGDGGSEDEGGNKNTKGSGGQLRTKNEVPEEIIPKPDVTITPEMKIQELGAVEAIVENILLIKANISGEYRVLESSSVLCLEDRNVIGAVSETLGRVQQPLYSVRFTNAGEITEAGLAIGTKVFYSEQHSTYVFTQSLKAYKGSDASNLHDEEVGDEEIEFSDDEAEAEHKKRLKQRRIEKRGGKMQQNGGSNRTGHPLQQQITPTEQSPGLNYDEADDDGPYKRLARPTGYGNAMGRNEAQQESGHSGERDRSNYSNRGDRVGDHRGRGRGDRGRSRGDRGRGGGERGRGRGGYANDGYKRDNNRHPNPSGYSLPPSDRPQSQYTNPPPSTTGHFPQLPLQSPQGTGFPQWPHAPPSTSYRPPQQAEYSPHQPQMWPQFPPPPLNFQQPPDMQNSWQNMPSPFNLPSGAFINPAFFTGNPPLPPNQTSTNKQREHGGSKK
jgi:H/ACA ribonucleoprotein complex non-core subunit NAF1